MVLKFGYIYIFLIYVMKTLCYVMLCYVMLCFFNICYENGTPTTLGRIAALVRYEFLIPFEKTREQITEKIPLVPKQ